MRDPEKISWYQGQLLKYLAEQDLTRGADRLLFLGGRNFVSKDIDGARAEMMASADRAIRSNNPLDHWLLSWREGEVPDERQIERAVKILLTELKLEGHQAIWAAHGDTHNIHVHVAVNRFDVHTERMRRLERDPTLNVDDQRDVDRAHMAVARIVHEKGWTREKKQSYDIVDDRIVLSEAGRASKEAKRNGMPSIHLHAASAESRTALKSAQRIAQEDGWPQIQAAQTWADLHARLAAKGMRFEAKGPKSGAVVIVGDQAVKASGVHRKATVASLQARLGVFQARQGDVVISKRDVVQDLMADAFRGEEFIAQIERHREQSGAIRGARKALTDLMDQAEQGMAAEVVGRDGVTPSLFDDAYREVLKEMVEEEFPAASRRDRGRADYEDWLRSENEAYFAEKWRHRNNPTGVVNLLVSQTEPRATRVARDIDGFVAHPLHDCVRYARPGAPTAFVEYERRIEVVTGLNDQDAVILAALKLADAKFDRFIITGSDQIKQDVARIAEAAGIAHKITNLREGPRPLRVPGLGDAPIERVRATGPSNSRASDGDLPMVSPDKAKGR